MLAPTSRCDCCGLTALPHTGDTCPHCGYPITPTQEIAFLEENITNLRRISRYGGTDATIAQLIGRYQRRLDTLKKYLAGSAGIRPTSEQSSSTVSVDAWQEYASPVAEPLQHPHPTHPTPMSEQQSSQAPVASPAQPTLNNEQVGIFSLKSFLAEQTITIVSSLGAFFILIGALGFIVTTSNLLLAFLVTFLVHALFAVTGTIFNRIAGFRLVSRIYLMIFALLVPLVGFSAYRLVSNHLIQFSTPTLISIAATYAAIVYTLLAVSQQYRPFGYLAATALVVADLSLASAFHVDLLWWPCFLIPLAFVSLVSMKNVAPRVFTDKSVVLREAMQVLLIACLSGLALGIFAAFASTQEPNFLAHSVSDARYALFVMLLLLFAWTSAFLLLSRLFNWLPVLAYELLICAFAFDYAFSFHETGYIISFILVATFYHLVTLHIHRFSVLGASASDLSTHLDSIAVILCCIIPFVAVPSLPLSVLVKAYEIDRFSTPFRMTPTIMSGLVAIVVGIALTGNVAFHRTSTGTKQARKDRRWLLLLSGFLFTSLYSLIILLLDVSPFWYFLVLTLALTMTTVVVRQFYGSFWMDVIDVIVLCESTFTIILSPSQSLNTILTLFLCFSAIAYAAILYQRREKLLFLPLIFALLALLPAWFRPLVMLYIGVALPLLSAGVHQFVTKRGHSTSIVASHIQRFVATRYSIYWEWPLVIVGLLGAALFCWHEALTQVSTLEIMLHLPLSAPLEVTLIAFAWYATALLTREKWMLLPSTVFAIVALLYPVTSFWTFALFAPVLLILAVAITRIFTRDWAIPFYVVSLVTEVVMGASAHTWHIPLSTTSWLLLGFAVLVYFTGIIENSPSFSWLGTLFAAWALLNFIQSDDVLRPTIIAVVCVAYALVLKKVARSYSITSLRFSLPIYGTAFLATLFVAGYSLFVNPDAPFYAATPCLLLLYAVLAYIIAVVERWIEWLWLVAAYAIGGMLLLLNTTACIFPISATQLGFATCSMQVHTTMYLYVGCALLTGILALVTKRLISPPVSSSYTSFGAFAWSWPWYITSLITIIVAALWVRGIDMNGMALIAPSLEYLMLFSFVTLTLIMMLLERKPVLLLLVAGLVVWALLRTQWSLWQVMIAFNVLFIAVFALQWLWYTLPMPRHVFASRLHALLALGGQACVVLFIISQGGLFADAGLLAHVGAGSLLTLAMLLFWYSHLDMLAHEPRVRQARWWCDYIAGLLVSLVITWELSALRQTHIDLLTITPATYLVVIAPFLARDTRIAHHHRISQTCSLLGSIVLLLPALWLSFSQSNLEPTLILAGESLTLLLVGVGTRIRIFVLSGAGLVVVSALHALFLPSLGIPSSLALTILGSVLLVLATALSLTRHRLQALWVIME